MHKPRESGPMHCLYTPLRPNNVFLHFKCVQFCNLISAIAGELHCGSAVSRRSFVLFTSPRIRHHLSTFRYTPSSETSFHAHFLCNLKHVCKLKYLSICKDFCYPEHISYFKKFCSFTQICENSEAVSGLFISLCITAWTLYQDHHPVSFCADS
jgi:hypothetical protein